MSFALFYLTPLVFGLASAAIWQDLEIRIAPAATERTYTGICRLYPSGGKLNPIPVFLLSSLIALCYLTYVTDALYGGEISEIFRYGSSSGLLFLFPLIQAALSDWKAGIIPDSVNFCILSMALLTDVGFQERLTGLAVPVLLHAVSAFIASALKKGTPFGGGDAKMLAAIGFTLGFSFLIRCFALASVISGATAYAGLLSGKLKKADKLPFAPPLSLSCIILMLL